MSANIPSTMPMSDLLKSTGYNCPEELQGKTFDEATSGGDTKISTNTAATVDVSTYTEPVEIEPAEGYDATKKVTLTLENIPSGSSATAYGWMDDGQVLPWWFSFDTAPENKTAFDNSNYLSIAVSNNKAVSIIIEPCIIFFGEGASYTFTKVSDTQFIINYEEQDITFTRNSTKDFTLWSN